MQRVVTNFDRFLRCVRDRGETRYMNIKLSEVYIGQIVRIFSLLVEMPKIRGYSFKVRFKDVGVLLHASKEDQLNLTLCSAEFLCCSVFYSTPKLYLFYQRLLSFLPAPPERSALCGFPSLANLEVPLCGFLNLSRRSVQ